MLEQCSDGDPQALDGANGNQNVLSVMLAQTEYPDGGSSS